MTDPATDTLPPIHPGEFLRDDLEALGLSARRFADHIGVPPNAVTGIMNGERRVTAPMDLRPSIRDWTEMPLVTYLR